MSQPIIIALDGLAKDQALRLACLLAGKVYGFKVTDLLDLEGVSIIRELKKFGQVFADPKLHDIPGTVAKRMKIYARAGASFVTVHASGGIEMMRAAVENREKSIVLAVTILTSLDAKSARLIYGSSLRIKVRELAHSAILAGVGGIVCSPLELAALARKRELSPLLKVTPGIRPQWYQTTQDDQARVMPPREAVRLGSDILVIGRPITTALKPLAALDQTIREIREKE